MKATTAALDASVIMPVYNAEPYLERCLRGLAEQSLDASRFEILLVDNNCSDRSILIARRFPRVTLLHEPRQGSYAARNRALDVARGRIIAFTDPDCIPAPDWLERIEQRFSDPDIQVLLGRVNLAARSYPARLLERYEHEKWSRIYATGDPAMYCGHTNNMAVRRETFQRVGPFAERQRGADTIFVHRVAGTAGGSAVAYAPDVVVEHLEIDGLATFYRKSFTYGQSRRSYRAQARVERLPTRERMRSVAGAARGERWPLLGSATLNVVLMTSAVCFQAGALSARIQPLRRKGGRARSAGQESSQST